MSFIPVVGNLRQMRQAHFSLRLAHDIWTSRCYPS